MPMSRWSTALAAAPLAALLLTGSATAQDAGTPAVGGERDERGEASRAVTPDLCEAPQADPAAVAAVLAGESDFQDVPINIPLGEPVDADTQDRIETNVRLVLSCLNATDYLRLASLTTDNGARFLLGGLAAEADVAARLAEAPAGRPEDALIRLVAITDPSILPDGRLAAFVVLNEPTNFVRGLETYLFVFQDDGDRVRLDGLFGFGRPQPPAGTPAP